LIERLFRRWYQRMHAPYERLLAEADGMLASDPSAALALLRTVNDKLASASSKDVRIAPYGRFFVPLRPLLLDTLFQAEMRAGDPAHALALAEEINRGVMRTRACAIWISRQAACLYRLGRRADARDLLIQHVEQDDASGNIKDLLSWMLKRDGAPAA
jgi:hypothetical protein